MFAIAIDGPAGAGKSSVAKAAAKELGFTYVDTGAIYRAIALYMLENGVDIEDPAAVTKALPGVEVSLEYGEAGQRTLLGGRDVSEEIRTQEVSMATSKWVAHIPEVREFLVEVQRGLARRNNVVMDGRDIGTCVLPDAEVKVYLTASPCTRAKRRFDELQEKGVECDLEAIQKDIEERDYRDMHRKTSPLRQAEDAVLIDSSELNIDEVVEAVYNIWKKRQ